MGLSLATEVDSMEIFDNSKWNFQFLGGPADEIALNEMSRRVLSVSTPFYPVTTTNKKSGRMFITGADPIGEVSISFIESPKLIVQRALVGWKESVFTSDSLLFHPASGYGTGQLNVFLNNDQTPIKSLMFYGMQCVSIDNVDFSYDSGPMIVTGNFIITNIGGYWADNEGTVSSPTYYN